MKVKVGARGMIVIPKKLREQFGVRQGDVLNLEPGKGVILMRKDKLWEKLKGSARGLTTAEDAEKDLDVEEREWEKRLQR